MWCARLRGCPVRVVRKPDQPIYDRKRRDWQHLHFFQYRALIHAELPRVRCSVCGERGETEVQQVAVPWARARSGFHADVRGHGGDTGGHVAHVGASDR